MIVKILSWNVNGIRSIAKKEALSWIDCYQPDILCLQETKLSSIDYKLNLFDKTYDTVSLNNSIANKGFSGTLTYSNLQVYNESNCLQIDYENDGRIIEQHYSNLVVFNVYFPNGKLNKQRLDRKLQFYDDLFNYCEQLKTKVQSIIICGDFNTAHKDIDLKKSKINNRSGFTNIERSALTKFLENGYLDTYRYINGDKEEAYTWWSYRSNGRESNEGWRIDYILISDDLKTQLKDAYILDNIKGSDHCPIGITIEI